MPGAFRQTDHSAVPSRLRPCGRIKKPLSRVNQRATTVGDNGADEAAPPGPNGFAGTTIATLAAVSVHWRRVPDARWRNGRADLHEAAPTACPPSGKAVPQGMDERRQRGVRCGMHGLLRDSHANFQPVDIEKQSSGGRSECGKPGAQRRVFHMETFKGAKRARGCGKPAGFSMAASPPSGFDEFASRPVPKTRKNSCVQGRQRKSLYLSRPTGVYGHFASLENTP